MQSFLIKFKPNENFQEHENKFRDGGKEWFRKAPG